jgi:hypothetical protein
MGTAIRNFEGTIQYTERDLNFLAYHTCKKFKQTNIVCFYSCRVSNNSENVRTEPKFLNWYHF